MGGADSGARHTGQIMKLDLEGKVVGMMAGAGPGKSIGNNGEAH
jgi:hypothetical protein